MLASDIMPTATTIGKIGSVTVNHIPIHHTEMLRGSKAHLVVGKPYQTPQEGRIGKIPLVIVDPHNEVFGYWFNQFHGAKPAVLLHIDEHEDDCLGASQMFSNTSGVQLMERQSKGTYPHEYAKEKLDCASFIVPSFYYGLISDFYWAQPHTTWDMLPNAINTNCELNRGVNCVNYTYSVFNNLPEVTTTVKGERHFVFRQIDGWEGKPYRFGQYLVVDKPALLMRGAIFDGQNSPLILDIDLDAFSLPKKAKGFFGHDLNAYINYARLGIARTTNLLRKLPAPALITISRSQNPKAYIEPELVDTVQQDVLDMLNLLYDKKT